MKSNNPDRTGWKIGASIVLKMAEIIDWRVLPERFLPGTAPAIRARLGIHSLAENLAISVILTLRSEKWTPALRNDLAKSFRDLAVLANAQIRLYDILSLRNDMEHFVKLNIDWLNRDGAEAVTTTKMSFGEAFCAMQEQRNIQFATMCHSIPHDEQIDLPNNHQKWSVAAIRATHSWILGTMTITEDSLAEAETILESVNQAVVHGCRQYLL